MIFRFIHFRLIAFVGEGRIEQVQERFTVNTYVDISMTNRLIAASKKKRLLFSLLWSTDYFWKFYSATFVVASILMRNRKNDDFA